MFCRAFNISASRVLLVSKVYCFRLDGCTVVYLIRSLLMGTWIVPSVFAATSSVVNNLLYMYNFRHTELYLHSIPIEVYLHVPLDCLVNG